MTDPVIPISWGELFDRLSILEIKEQRLQSEAGRATARKQSEHLREAATRVGQMPRLIELRASLKQINERLWSIEDALRDHEARKAFDARFVELARGVYRNNDERSRVKRAIDDLLGSESEPKGYTRYDVQSRAPDGSGSP